MLVRITAGEEAEKWHSKVQEASNVAHSRASSLASTYGTKLGVSKADVLWGMGQVMSIALLLTASTPSNNCTDR